MCLAFLSMSSPLYMQKSKDERNCNSHPRKTFIWQMWLRPQVSQPLLFHFPCFSLNGSVKVQITHVWQRICLLDIIYCHSCIWAHSGDFCFPLPGKHLCYCRVIMFPTFVDWLLEENFHKVFCIILAIIVWWLQSWALGDKSSNYATFQ